MSHIIFSQIRFASTKPKKITRTVADKIKELNYENKALFGAVQKPVKLKSEKISTPPHEESDNLSSEMYWLTQYKHEIKEQPKHESLTKKRLKAVSSSSISNYESLMEKRLKQRSSTTITKLCETLKTLRKTTIKSQPEANNLIEIPFTNTDLKSLLKFPLILESKKPEFEGIDSYASTYPSVGKILQATMTDSARKSLLKWKIDKITELGEDGFHQLQQTQLTEGKRFHEALETYFTKGTTPDESSDVYKVWESITPALQSLQPDIQLTETFVEHPFLKYRGVVDCVSTISSQLNVIEWKKSEKMKNTIAATFDAPLQLCAYLGALNADPKHNLIAKKGFVIVAYTDGRPANVHEIDEIDLKKYWKVWLHKVQEFWIRTRDGTLPEPV